MRRGLTLLETILSLAIFFVVILAGLESFGTARQMFFRLREAQESRLAALGALDKIRTDVLQAGWGLSALIRLGLEAGFEEEAGGLAFWNAEKVIPLADDLKSGQSFIAVAGMAEVAAGRRIGVSDGEKGEVAAVAAASSAGLTLFPSLGRDYSAGRTTLVLLRRVMIYLDAAGRVLRRKINSASGQPLLEGVATFGLELEPASARATIRLGMDGKPEVLYATTITAKNLALARTK
jgi:type II secretory pathway pseudopilin PulG